MVDAIRCTHRLGFIALLLVGPGCVQEDGGPPATRPAALTAPVGSCKVTKPESGFELPVWDLFVLDGDWSELHEDVSDDVEVDAQLCMDGVLEPIELELQGTSGRLRDKKSFKIKFERDHSLADVELEEGSRQEIDKVYLKALWIDQSLIREAVAFDLWREMGHVAPRTGFVNLRINGDYWGLYHVVEPVDDEYIERNGYPTGGRLYKATRKHGSRADFAPGRDLAKAFEDKTDDDDESRTELAALLDVLQKTPLDEAAFERRIDPIFSLDDYIDRMVWIAFTRNGDAVAQNFYLYNARDDGRAFWYQIPWDSDLCLGSSWRDRDDVVSPDKSPLLDGGNYFGRRLIMVPGLRERYFARFHEVLDEVLAEPVALRYVDEHARRVRHDLAIDQLRWRRRISPDEAFDVIRQFIRERPDILREAIDDMISMEAAEPLAPTDSTEAAPPELD